MTSGTVGRSDAISQLHWFKGRGAVTNPQGRFERLTREPTQDSDPAQFDEPAANAPHTEVSAEYAKSIIARNQSDDIFFELSVNPYRGCEHGCIYCYARPQHSFIGLSPGQDFETRLRAKVNAVELLTSEIDAPGYRCSAINIGSVTDAYQPIEKQWRLARGLVGVLVERKHPFTIITKSALVERDIDLLAAAAQQGLTAVYVSVTTLDSKLAGHWEPRASAPWRRIETIRRLSEAGVPVGVMVAPIVPFLNEPEIEHILEAAKQAGAGSAHYTVLRLPHELREVFVNWLRHHYPDRADRVLARIMDLRGGKKFNDSEFFTRMKGVGAWSELIRMRFEMATRKHGLSRDKLLTCSELFESRAVIARQMSLFGIA